MNALKNLTDSELVATTQKLVAEERRITAEVIRHIHEIDRRRLYSARGHSSLFEMLTRELGYSEAAAWRRISTARLLGDVPEVEDKIRTGALTVSAASQAQSAFQALKRERQPCSEEKKREVLHALEGQSKREAEKTLIALLPALPVAALRPDRERAVSETLTEVRFTADEKLRAKLTRVQELLSHRVPRGAGHAALLDAMAEIALDQLDPERRDARAKARQPKANGTGKNLLPPAEVKSNSTNDTAPSRFIPTPLRREVWLRDQGQCTYLSTDTQRRCDSRQNLELDHIQPLSKGGASTEHNLRLLCKAHNTRAAIDRLGSSAMAPFLPGLRT